MAILVLAGIARARSEESVTVPMHRKIRPRAGPRSDQKAVKESRTIASASRDALLGSSSAASAID